MKCIEQCSKSMGSRNKLGKCNDEAVLLCLFGESWSYTVINNCVYSF
jgi:hypothetical protein